MRIGFDLDNVFINTPPFLPYKAIDLIYKKETKKRLEYRIPKNPDLLLRKLLHFPLFRPPIKENISFLKSLPKANNSLYLITGRFGYLKKRTAEILQREHIDDKFNEMYFNYDDLQPHFFKNEIIKKLDLDMYVDDDLDLIKYVAKHNKKTQFFWLNPTRTGQISFNITAITDIKKILQNY